MSRSIQFPTGFYQAIIGWTTLNFEWALMDSSWPQDESVEVYMADISAYECAAVGYSRQSVTSPSVSIGLAPAAEGLGYIGLLCDPPQFGVLSDFNFYTSVVLFNQVTNDADSPIVAAIPCSYLADGSAADFLVSATLGPAYVSTSC